MISGAELILSLITISQTPFVDSHPKATLHTIISVRTNKSNTKNNKLRKWRRPYSNFINSNLFWTVLFRKKRTSPYIARVKRLYTSISLQQG